MKTTLTLLFGFCAIYSSAQFAPAAGYAGSTAIGKDSSLFVAWATGCTLQRGYMDIAVPDSGYASVGTSNSATGAAGQNGVVSLGDSGVATLTFAQNIYNGPGFDFAVFENGFYTGAPSAFLELAFVEVSSDGVNFFRFPATSNLQDTAQLAMAGSDCQLINNLAGKYVFGYGTPFDLEELKNEAGLDVSNITHVRVVDVVGSLNDLYATHDQYGHKVNDPYPTPFASSGFDLDAVGVIHAVGITAVDELTAGNSKLVVYPNPSTGNVFIQVSSELIGQPVSVYDITGKLLTQQTVPSGNWQLATGNYSKGLYLVTIAGQTTKLLIE